MLLLASLTVVAPELYVDGQRLYGGRNETKREVRSFLYGLIDAANDVRRTLFGY